MNWSHQLARIHHDVVSGRKQNQRVFEQVCDCPQLQSNNTIPSPFVPLVHSIPAAPRSPHDDKESSHLRARAGANALSALWIMSAVSARYTGCKNRGAAIEPAIAATKGGMSSSLRTTRAEHISKIKPLRFVAVRAARKRKAPTHAGTSSPQETARFLRRRMCSRKSARCIPSDMFR
jgi:hypothetical protein